MCFSTMGTTVGGLNQSRKPSFQRNQNTMAHRRVWSNKSAHNSYWFCLAKIFPLGTNFYICQKCQSFQAAKAGKQIWNIIISNAHGLVWSYLTWGSALHLLKNTHHIPSCKTFVPWHLGQLHEGFRHVEAAEDSKMWSDKPKAAATLKKKKNTTNVGGTPGPLTMESGGL